MFVRPRGGWRSETQTAELTASDGAAGDLLGTGVAIRGDSILTGAPLATVNGNQSQGAVYAFVKPRGGWANETETAKLTASDGLANDGLGLMVALSRDTLAAGSAATVNGNSGQGAVYVFTGHARDPPTRHRERLDSTRYSDTSRAAATRIVSTLRRPPASAGIPADGAPIPQGFPVPGDRNPRPLRTKQRLLANGARRRASEQPLPGRARRWVLSPSSGTRRRRERTSPLARPHARLLSETVRARRGAVTGRAAGRLRRTRPAPARARTRRTGA